MAIKLYSVTQHVPPSGGSLEIGNRKASEVPWEYDSVPPSGGSLEIGNAF